MSESIDAIQFKSAFEDSGIGMAIVGKNGSWIKVNQKLCEILGYNPEQLMCLTFQDITHPEDLNNDLEKFKELQEGKIKGYEMEKRYFRKDGNTIWILLTACGVFSDSGEYIHCISQIQDITARKKLENDLKASNSELEEFAYIASHDLKAPLRGINSLAIWIEEEIRSSNHQFTSSFDRNLFLLKDRVYKMNTIIEGLLEYSRIGRRNLDKKYIFLLNSINNIILDYKSVGDLQVDVNIDQELAVYANEIRINQLFSNIIENAIKHNDKKEKIIKIYFKKNNDGIEVYFQDNGPGIEEQYREKVFKIFQTLKTDTKESTGIGLALAKRIMDNLKGYILVESNEWGGATFKMFFPNYYKEEIYVRRT